MINLPTDLSLWFAMTTEGPTDLLGYVVDGLVLHSAHYVEPSPGDECWRISHVASGRVVIPHTSYEEALALLEALLASGVDWSQEQVQATPEVRHLVRLHWGAEEHN